MGETFYAGVYWLGRKESIASCAQRAEHFFRSLAALDPTWSRWFHVGRTREHSLRRPIEPVAATFEATFARGKNQLPEGGVQFGAWNVEAHGDASDIDFTCGSSSRFSKDVCVLNLPHSGPIAERVLTTPMMIRVLTAMALAWEPDKGVVISDAYRDLVAPDKLPHVLVGWVTYLSRRRGQVPPLPEPVRVEPIEDKGSLIILTPERFSASNPAHVELAERVRERLDQAGLLGPTLPWDSA